MAKAIAIFILSFVLFDLGSIDVEEIYRTKIEHSTEVYSSETEIEEKVVLEKVYETIMPENITVAYGQDASADLLVSWTDKHQETDAFIELDGNIFKARPVEVETKLSGKPYVYYRYSARATASSEGSTATYRIGYGSDRRSGWHTLELPAEDETASLLFFGDIQGYKQSDYDAFKSVYDTAVKETGTPDLTLLAGDIVDTGGRFEEWQYLFNVMNSVFPTMPVMAAPGNHDTVDRAVFESTFQGPDNGVEGLDNRNYYIDIGNARIAVLDTESTNAFNAQKEWLKKIMSEAEADYRIVLMHRSVFPMLYDEPHIRNWHNTFMEADIDLVLSGHDHIYSRTLMDGVAYVCGGSGSGSKYYEADMDSNYRYWMQEVYDTNLPVFVSITTDSNGLTVQSHSVQDGEPILIDTFSIE